MRDGDWLTRKERRECKKIIGMCLPMSELLAQGAEEAAELSQALLKMRRVVTGVNPTPKTFREVQDNIFEEMADLKVCMEEIGYFGGNVEVKKWEDHKLRRWAKRLKQRIAQEEIQ